MRDVVLRLLLLLLVVVAVVVVAVVVVVVVVVVFGVFDGGLEFGDSEAAREHQHRRQGVTDLAGFSF